MLGHPIPVRARLSRERVEHLAYRVDGRRQRRQQGAGEARLVEGQIGVETLGERHAEHPVGGVAAARPAVVGRAGRAVRAGRAP